MCGRTACTLAPDEVSRASSYRDRGGRRRQPTWRDGDADKYRPSYNKSPQSMSPVLLSQKHFDKNAPGDECVLAAMRWGLIPAWFREKDPSKMQYSTTNCRREGLLEKKSFKDPLIRGQRCVILADGFYEWRRQEKEKQPYFIYFPQTQGGHGEATAAPCTPQTQGGHGEATAAPCTPQTQGGHGEATAAPCTPQTQGGHSEATAAPCTPQTQGGHGEATAAPCTPQTQGGHGEATAAPCTPQTQGGHGEATAAPCTPQTQGGHGEATAAPCTPQTQGGHGEATAAPCTPQTQGSCSPQTQRGNSEAKAAPCIPEEDTPEMKEEDKEEDEWNGWRLLTIAGLFDCWTPPDGGEALYTYSVITVEASPNLQGIHDRMPAILDGEEEVRSWLDFGEVKSLDALKLLHSKNILTYHPVSTFVNNSRNNSPECLQPVDLQKKKEPKPTASSKMMMSWLKSSAPSKRKEPETCDYKEEEESKPKPEAKPKALEQWLQAKKPRTN